MALDPVSILFGIIDFARITVIIAIPVFIIALLALEARKALEKKFSLSWIQGAIVTTYLAVTIILIFLYLVPYYLAWQESEIAKQTAPSILALTTADIATAIIFAAAKILASAVVLTILLLPLEFFAAFVSDKLKEKKIPGIGKTFIAAYCSCALAAIIAFAFPWIIVGIFYMIYWG